MSFADSKLLVKSDGYFQSIALSFNGTKGVAVRSLESNHGIYFTNNSGVIWLQRKGLVINIGSSPLIYIILFSLSHFYFSFFFSIGVMSNFKKLRLFIYFFIHIIIYLIYLYIYINVFFNQ
jgi:hypothetical protein